ncbi:MAG: hypothetical protein IKP10_03035 [Clostridia bacterium]|nr:hypothetical protein [Clostridia bacterium]
MYTYTQDQLEGWKKKFGDGNVFEVAVEDKKVILHKPSRRDISYAMAGSNQAKDSVKFSEILLNQCWIDGDEEIKENDDYFLAVVPVLGALAETKEAEIKKL